MGCNMEEMKWDMLKLNSWLHLNRSGVLLLVNEEKKKFWITAANNMVTSMYVFMSKIDTKVNKDFLTDVNNIEIKILDRDISGLSKSEKLLITTNIAKEMLASGYTEYKKIYTVNYKVKKRIAFYKNKAYWRVHVINGQKTKTLVGVFYEEDECDAFLAKHYPNSQVISLVYSDNQVTKKWIAEGIFGHS
jgi:hypothetical protein